MTTEKRKCATCPNLVEIETEFSDNDNSTSVICEDCAGGMAQYDISPFQFNPIFKENK